MRASCAFHSKSPEEELVNSSSSEVLFDEDDILKHVSEFKEDTNLATLIALQKQWPSHLLSLGHLNLQFLKPRMG